MFERVVDKSIYFLKELPDKYLLVLVLLIMLGVAMRFGAVEPREVWLLVRDITIAIISIAGYKRLQATQEVNADIKTDSVEIKPADQITSSEQSPDDVEKH